MLSMMDGLSPSSQTSKPCQKEINAPNLGEVKGSIRVSPSVSDSKVSQIYRMS